MKLANKCEQELGEKIRQINEIYLSSMSIFTDIEWKTKLKGSNNNYRDKVYKRNKEIIKENKCLRGKL